MDVLKDSVACDVQEVQRHGAATVTWNDTGSFSCVPEDTLLAAALRAGVGLPYECNAGGCGSCKVVLLDGQVNDLRPDAPGIKLRERERGKILACQCVPEGDCKIAFNEDVECRPVIKPKRRAVTLVSYRDITRDIREFCFVGEQQAEFLAGQYALLHIPGIGGTRSYSMSNTANEEGIWEFQIKRVPGGAGSGWLFDQMREGAIIELDGPYSSAFLREETKRSIVCIAGGSGLAPMVSVIRGALQSPKLLGVDIHLFYGGREPVDMFQLADFDDLSSAGSRLEITQVLSVGESEDARLWSGERGFVHECVGRLLRGRFSDAEFYLAGPPPMVEAVRRMLVLDEQVPIERVHYDRFF
jgi:toluene monooxygenase electron transfer component